MVQALATFQQHGLDPKLTNWENHSYRPTVERDIGIGNESVPIQLAQCRFIGLVDFKYDTIRGAISQLNLPHGNAKIIYFFK